MTYFTPDVDTISLQGAAVIQSGMGRDTTLPRSMLGLLNKVVSGATDGLYGAIDTAAADIIYDTASEAALVRWAGIWGLTLKAPTAATGIVTFTGGAGTIPEGAILARQDGIQYALETAVLLIDSVGEGTVTCLSAGAMTNLADGAVLTLVAPTAGVSPNVVVGGDGLSAGADMETVPELLTRLLIRIRQSPQGGSNPDFEEWALAVPGVTRAWVRKWWNGPGTTGVLFMCDDRINPIPLDADVAAVQAALDLAQPAVGTAYAVAPMPVALNFSIRLEPGSAAIESAVQADLADLISNECVPGGTLPLTQIIATISASAGVIDFVLSTPVANVTPAGGSITTMGVITWL